MLKTILIVTTGGTIAMKNAHQLLKAEELLHYFPSFTGIANVVVEEFITINSAAILPQHWVQLDALLNRQLARPDIDGAVLLHGTDSLEESAFFLNLSLQSAKPLILTGAMRYLDDRSSDGSTNLYNAVRLAASPAAHSQGPLVLMNEHIFAARDVLKYDNLRLHTFRSPYGPLGSVDPDSIRFYRHTSRPHTLATAFDLAQASTTTLPLVPLLADYTGFRPALFQSLLAGPIDGLVVQSFAGGRRSAGMSEALKALRHRGLPIVVASRIMEGPLVPPQTEEGLFYAEDLSPQKARILLLLSLLMGHDTTQLQQNFRNY